MKRALLNSSLSIFFGLIFVAALVGQAFAGKGELNDQRVADGLDPVTLAAYVSSAHFAVDVAENWQSEYLQFLLFILATVWLVQRGSPESKPLGKPGRESDEDQKIGAHAGPDSPAWAKTGGWRTVIFSRSLSLVMGLIFVVARFAQSLAGWAVYNEDRIRQLQEPVDWSAYVASAEFWSRTLQNWQSEFLAVGSMVVLAIFLRERGSPESKPVGEANSTTGVTG